MKGKRMVAWLLVFAMSLSSVEMGSFPVHAEESNSESADVTAGTVSADVTAGICKTALKTAAVLSDTGETVSSVTYSYDEDTKTLTISGQGAMKDYEVDTWDETTAPWYGLVEKALKIVIEDGVTHIGNCAFYKCYKVQEIIIGNDVETIGYWAFWGCNSAKKLTVGKKVKEIGWRAFNGSAYLEEVHISDLAAWCGIEYDGDSSYPSNFSGFFVDTYLYLNGEKVTELTIPETVTKISSHAFCGYCGIKKIVFHDNITSIGSSAFGNCEISEIAIPSKVTRIETATFAGCTNLTKVEWPEKLASIGESAFSQCGFSTLMIPETVTSLGERVFYKCTNLTEIKIPDSVLSVGEYLFYGCTKLADVTMPVQLAQIPNSMFQECVSLKNIELPETVTSIGESAFSGCTLLNHVDIPDAVTSIGSSAFQNCTSLEKITFPNSITTVGTEIFKGCTALADLYYSGSKTEWAAISFGADNDILLNTTLHFALDGLASGVCGENLTWIIEEDGTLRISGEGPMTEYTATYEVPWHALLQEEIKKLVIEEGATKIAQYAFDGRTLLETVALPTTLEKIANYAFRNCTSLEKVIFTGDAPTIANDVFTGVTCTCYYPEGNATYDNYIMAKDFGGTLLWTYEGEVEDYICGETVSWEITEDGILKLSGTGEMYDYEISELEYAPWYESRDSILSVEIGDGITKIGNGAFYNCNHCKAVTISDSVTKLGEYAFANTALSSVDLSENITEVGKNVFSNCLKLTSVSLPDSLTYISDSMFNCCNYLRTVEFQTTLKTIGNYAFANCYELRSVTLPEGLISIGDGAFTVCGPCDLYRGDYSFGFTKVTLPSTLQSIGKNAFRYCQALQEINIPEGVTKIESSTFEYCYRLTSITLPKKIISIDKDAFFQCKALTKITFSWAVPEINANTFGRVTATCYYPSNNTEWTAAKRQNYGGTLTWVGSTMEAPEDGTGGGSGDQAGLEEGEDSNQTGGNQGETTGNENNTDGSNTGGNTTGGNTTGGNTTGGNAGSSTSNIAISISNVGAGNSGAVITAPIDGWKTGTNTFTVSCDKACIVVVSYDGGLTYMRLTATEVEDGYSFTADNLTENAMLAVLVLGDVNGDGKITTADAAKANAAILGKASLDTLSLMAADVNNSGTLTTADTAKIQAVVLGKTTFSW